MTEPTSTSFYKVLVRVNNGPLESASRNINSEYIVFYDHDVEVYPKLEGSKLFIFGCLESAKEFYTSFVDAGHIVELWSCQPTNPVLAPEITSPSWMYKYWQLYNTIGIEFEDDNYMAGTSALIRKAPIQYPNTYFCESLRLVEKIMSN